MAKQEIYTGYNEKPATVPDRKCPDCGGEISGWRDKFRGEIFSCQDSSCKWSNKRRSEVFVSHIFLTAHLFNMLTSAYSYKH